MKSPLTVFKCFSWLVHLLPCSAACLISRLGTERTVGLLPGFSLHTWHIWFDLVHNTLVLSSLISPWLPTTTQVLVALVHWRGGWRRSLVSPYYLLQNPCFVAQWQHLYAQSQGYVWNAECEPCSKKLSFAKCHISLGTGGGVASSSSKHFRAHQTLALLLGTATPQLHGTKAVVALCRIQNIPNIVCVPKRVGWDMGADFLPRRREFLRPTHRAQEWKTTASHTWRYGFAYFDPKFIFIPQSFPGGNTSAALFLTSTWR